MMARALPPRPSCTLASGIQRTASECGDARRRCTGRGGVPADDFEPGEQLLGEAAARSTPSSGPTAAGFLLSALALVLERQDDEQLAVAFGQVGVERLEHVGRQGVVLGAAVDQLLAPSMTWSNSGRMQLHEVGALLDDVGAADGLDLGAFAVAQGDADAVAFMRRRPSLATR